MVLDSGKQCSRRKVAPTYACITSAPEIQRLGGYLNPLEGTNVVVIAGEITRRGMVPVIGFELMTYRLQGGCSTN
jgi:hypothetical protein